MSEFYYAAACQTAFECPADRSSIDEHTRRMCTIAEQTIVGYEPFFDVRLLAFPEFAHAAPIYDSIDKLRDRLAVPIPNEHTERYTRLARQYGCYIQTGTFLEVDSAYPDAVFNTTLLIGPQGILSKYRKVNPWIPWELHASPHDIEGYSEDLFPVVETELGRLGVAICYDWLFPTPGAQHRPWTGGRCSTGHAPPRTRSTWWQRTRGRAWPPIRLSAGPAAAWWSITTAGSSPRPIRDRARRSWLHRWTSGPCGASAGVAAAMTCARTCAARRTATWPRGGWNPRVLWPPALPGQLSSSASGRRRQAWIEQSLLMALLPEIPAGVTDSPARLTPAVLQAAEWLGLYRAELARVLNLQCADIGRLGAAREQLVPGSRSWQQAVLFIRLYRALLAIMEADEAAMFHWLRAENRQLQGVPLLLLVDEGRLAEVLDHLLSLTGAAACQ